jgi:hypothetical protein
MRAYFPFASLSVCLRFRTCRLAGAVGYLATLPAIGSGQWSIGQLVNGQLVNWSIGQLVYTADYPTYRLNPCQIGVK